MPGLGIAEDPETLITGGPREWRPADVSSMFVVCRKTVTQTKLYVWWYFCLCVFDQYPHVTPAAVATKIVSSVCSKCGTIEKSGQSSCCARGGSWFKNCGGTGNAKVDHTWYEGINACKAQGQQLKAAQQQESEFANHVVTRNFKSVIMGLNTFSFNIPTNVMMLTSEYIVSTSTSTAKNTGMPAGILVPISTDSLAHILIKTSTNMPISNPISGTPMTPVLTDMFATALVYTSDNTSTLMSGCETLVKIVVQITCSLWLIIEL